jgi:serine/threonine-protein kinase
MPLAIGTQLGSHEITALLGKGGMGEVYRARDLKLKREVAIKILPDEFARDTDRVSRFQKEAEVLASLNHPNIANIYDLEEQNGSRYLVLELVEGETLADRIARGPIPVEEALRIAIQISEALEAAHERGIIHRDLKPANVKITPDGKVKVLDFGLARTLDKNTAGTTLSNSPTLSLAATNAGVIMGTAGYMSPEQARGKPVDKRADIWAFGVVLWEMLTGEQLFQGDEVADTLARVLTQQPDLEKTPPQVRKLLRRCLEKDPRQRLRDIGEVRFWLDDGPPTSASGSENAPPRFGYGWIAAGVLALALAGMLWVSRSHAPDLKPLVRLNVDLGPNATAGGSTTVAISSDGTRIVFPVRGDDGKQRLATRLLDQQKETVLSGTEDGKDPFFSPDGQWVGFFSPGKMKKISVLGGSTPVTLCDAGNPRGASWGEDGYIIVNLGIAAGLSRVSDSGGTPEPLSKLEGEIAHRWPQVLPRGRGVLFTGAGRSNVQEVASIRVWLPQTGTAKTLLQNGYFGRFVSAHDHGGYLLYIHEGSLFAVPFDLDRMELQGKPVPVLEDLSSDPIQGGGQFGFSKDGTFLYLSGMAADPNTTLAWLDSSGRSESLIPPGQYRTPRLSPDGRNLALASLSGGTQNIYVYDLQRLTTQRLTFTPTTDSYPTWTPDGKHLAFTSSGTSIWWVRADGAGQPQQLLARDPAVTTRVPYSFSPDGTRLSYYQLTPETSADIWTMTLDLWDPEHPKPGKPEPFQRTPSSEERGAFSPDGRWMAYESNESGTFQIYVQPFPGPGGKWQVSNSSGRDATWSRAGNQLFFETNDGYLMVADWTVKGETFVPGKPRQWSSVQLRDMGSLNMTLHPDGKRFVIFPASVKTPEEKTGNLHATFLLNFTDELRRRVPEGK